MIRYVYDPQTFRLARLRSEPTPASPPAHHRRSRITGTLTTSSATCCPCTTGHRAAGSARRRISSTGPSPTTPSTGSPRPPAANATFPPPDAVARHPALHRPDQGPRLHRDLRLRRRRQPAQARRTTQATGGYVRSYDIPRGWQPSHRHDHREAPPTATATTPAATWSSETTSRLFEWNHANSSPPSARKPPTPSRPSMREYRYDGSGQRVLKIVRKQGGQLSRHDLHRWALRTDYPDRHEQPRHAAHPRRRRRASPSSARDRRCPATPPRRSPTTWPTTSAAARRPRRLRRALSTARNTPPTARPASAATP